MLILIALGGEFSPICHCSGVGVLNKRKFDIFFYKSKILSSILRKLTAANKAGILVLLTLLFAKTVL